MRAHLEGSLSAGARESEGFVSAYPKQTLTCLQEEDLRRRAQAMRAHLEGSLSAGAREFEDIVEVLVAAGALDPDTLTPRPLGEAARQLNGENELWLATVMTNPAVQVNGMGQSAGPSITTWRVVKLMIIYYVIAHYQNLNDETQVRCAIIWLEVRCEHMEAACCMFV